MRVIFGKPQPENPSLFAGQAWMDAAEAWAESEGGLTITRFRVDHHFQIGSQWFRADWHGGVDGGMGEWTFTPCED